MGWIESIREAIDFIEENITEEITLGEIAKEAMISPFYFQKGFAMLCGFTVAEYIRQRRLALAGMELVSTEEKVIDIAIKYGYESPDSFTKAFVRFHGVTPSAVRKTGATIKSFAPLRLKFSLEGGFIMNYKIVEKEAFTVVGFAKKFHYDEAFAEIPKFWDEYCQTGKYELISGKYGVNMDETMGNSEFEYLIAEDYAPYKEIPEGCVTKVIPKFTWAVFPCTGGLPKSFQEVNSKIFSEWLPNCKEYEIAAGYNIEFYSDPSQYPKGTQDENYYCEAWIPVKKKV